MAAEVDRVLDKISEKGIASLTPAERRFLDEVSRQKKGPHESEKRDQFFRFSPLAYVCLFPYCAAVLINLLPDFLAVLEAHDREAAYRQYREAHRPILDAYWRNYVLDPDSPARR